MPTTYAIPDGRTVMAATIWDGDNTTSRSISTAVNGVSFQPDFVWVKARNNAREHILEDSVRGLSYNNQLSSNSTGAESSNPTAGGVTGASSTTITLGGTGTMDNVNKSTWTYVGWQWKKGASSGFDVVAQTLATTGTNTVTHSLNVVPTMVLAKKRGATEQWLVYHSSGTTQSQYLGLNTTTGVATSGNLWGSSAFTSSQIYFTGTSGDSYVFYIFAPIAGYSAFGSYTGNGVVDGPFVYLGFRPRWIMIKSTVEVSAGYTSWEIIDTSTMSYNAPSQGTQLWANRSAAQGYRGLGTGADTVTGNIDILSNGFKIRSDYVENNYSGTSYIYAAFAENPFKYSNAR
jgi:hypothetical protein